MLKQLEADRKQDLQKETTDYALFSTWCTNTEAEKKGDIGAGELSITVYRSEMMDNNAKSEAATDAAANADAANAKAKASLKDLRKVRSADKAEYNKERADLESSIFAVQKAIVTLNAVPDKVEAVTALLQIKLGKKAAYLQQPFTAASERKSGFIINLLGDLKGKFNGQMKELTDREISAVRSFELQDQALNQEMDTQGQIEKEQTQIAVDSDSAAGKAKEALALEEQSTADTRKYLETVVADCALKANDFANRQKSRNEEILSIAEAVQMLEGDDMKAGAAQLSKVQSVGKLLQVRKSGKTSLKSNSLLVKTQKQTIRKFKNFEGNVAVADFLRAKAQKLSSKILMQLAEQATADPFVKVRELVQSLINRLEQQTKQEQTHKQMCDKQMKENAANIKEFSTKVKKLTAEIEVLNSDISEGKKSKERLTKELKEMRADLAQATTLRAQEKQDNELTIKEGIAAEAALDQALSVLSKYYNKGALMQTKQVTAKSSQAPQFAAGAYESSAPDGVLGLLEVIKSQTSQMVRETQSAEEKAKEAHEAFATETETSIAQKDGALKHTEVTLAETHENLVDADAALNGEDGAKRQLALYEKQLAEVITPMCIAKGQSFEEKSAKRDAEIQSLTEALAILENFGNE